jgi:2-succinyl-5-enolpyruvyl-6-hydroxy-3-cyclohexene-1-carboxylate synthase
MTPLATWAAALVDALAASGVRDVVVSPGSRSTPYVLAALAHDDLRCRAVIDERVAGFVALGMAKRSGRPVALLCTSGTAGAHYLPAIIEAAYSHTPLIAITADRPPELVGNGASQTIDQRELFGRHVRAASELGVPEGGDTAVAGLRRKVAQTVAAAQWPTPGPVHLNAPARKPLEPPTLASLRGHSFGPVPRHAPPALAPNAAAIAELAAAIARSPRGIIACGPGPLAQRGARAAVRELARRAGYPLFAEAASQLRFGAPPAHDGLDAALRSPAFRAAAVPDLVLQLGAAPVSTGWQLYARQHASAARFAIAPHGWHDPDNTATIVPAELDAALAALLAALPERPANPAWLERFTAAEARTRQAVIAEHAERVALTEAAVARATVRALPTGGLLALGNSNSIRAVDAFCRSDDADVGVLSQRGVAGIDGLVASAAGAAIAGGEPTALLLGDVSLAHDLGGLAAARTVATPLAIVVVDNRGGRIFEQLPVAALADLGAALDTFWLTPPALDFASAATTFGVRYARVEAVAALRAALSEALAKPGCSLIHALVEPGSVTAQLRRVWEAAA